MGDDRRLYNSDEEARFNVAWNYSQNIFYVFWKTSIFWNIYLYVIKNQILKHFYF